MHARKIWGFSKPNGGVLPTGRSISDLGKKQKPWINREQGVEKFLTFDEFSSSGTEAKLSFLQTLCVLIRCQGQEKIICAVIDSGSLSRYVSEKSMTQLNTFPLRMETVIHALFGGDETEPKSHEVFAIEVSSLNRVFSCGFEAFS
ncbi:uncharacterized protein NPIL_605661 [Nephila pilipes]|uniref:Uncharacterized protein n=1 Tax=Nephila pilipes TaxID=299642 RepID=A0A8X6PSD9_NEPPI|nr:uncharacterized protein NPIL_605661 [Nephila pilipes]